MTRLSPLLTTRTKAPVPWRLELASVLAAVLLEDGLDLIDVADLAGEMLRIVGERAIERRYLGVTER
jgi:hypothetical protein